MCFNLRLYLQTGHRQPLTDPYSGDSRLHSPQTSVLFRTSCHFNSKPSCRQGQKRFSGHSTDDLERWNNEVHMSGLEQCRMKSKGANLMMAQD